jgi:hypothetical protein
MTSVRNPLLWVLTAGALCACGGFSGNDDSTGRIGLAVTDAPVDGAARVFVEFTGITFRQADGRSVTFGIEPPRAVDLLALTGANSEFLVENAEVPAGGYDLVQFHINAESQTLDSYVEFADGSQVSITVSSGSLQRLRHFEDYMVPGGGRVDLTVDFDLRKSLQRPDNGDYFLRPALRMVDNAGAGHLAGAVREDVAGADTCSAAVYIYDGHGATPGEMCSQCSAPGARPLTSTLVRFNDQSARWEYEVGFLAAGPYTAALTCNGAADDPQDIDGITFIEQHNVSIAAGDSALRDF